MKGGRIEKLMLLPNDANATHRRTLVLPSRLVGKGSLNGPAVKATTSKGSNSLIAVEFKGPTNLIGDTK
ncbi:MAG: hypothetical protein NT105_16155 [Verrucomicrobia bacterium]|nr:hypothetical protein [Verrucomicrobiota bacterium]